MRPPPYWRGDAGVSGALDTRRERLTALIGRIAVTALTLMSLYALLLSALPKAAAALTVKFAITPLIITISAAVMGPMVLCSGFPRSFFGLQTDNWKSVLAFSVLPSLAFLAATASLKLALIHTTETFSSCSLFQAMFAKTSTRSPLWVALGLYLALAPLQEFVVRCCLQAPLHAFLSGTKHGRVWSILVSDLFRWPLTRTLALSLLLLFSFQGCFGAGYSPARTRLSQRRRLISLSEARASTC
jgi:hypothetical protein